MTATALSLGSLCSSIDGLALGVERALGARTVWQSEIDPHASTVLAHRWPDTPNLGDLTAVDWASVEPVDVMCFGFPCQDISQAGRKAGLEGDRSALWFDCAHAVRVLRPRYVLVENVGALLVRGFDVVLADLAEMGYVGQWGCLRSSQVGAPHRRERVFVAAAHVGGAGTGVHAPTDAGAATADATYDGQPGRWSARRRRPGPEDRSGSAPDADSEARATGDTEPGDSATQAVRRGAQGPGGRRSSPADADQPGRQGVRPSFAARRSESPISPAADPDGERLALGPELDSDPQTRLEPPRRDHVDGRDLWGPYGPAIRRWEAIHGPAPAPRDKRGRLNPELCEWMLGFPQGWVTGPELDIPRTAQLRLLGNAVQPQVAELAAQLLLPLLTTETAA